MPSSSTIPAAPVLPFYSEVFHYAMALQGKPGAMRVRLTVFLALVAPGKSVRYIFYR